jgi:rhodanese-related sulfurtransferase
MNVLQSLFGSSLPSVSAEELNEKLKAPKRPFVVDVRQPEEFRTGHIISAKLIPVGELKERMNELPKDKEIVCVCASGSRSKSATKMLVSAGYNAVNMNGGMMVWSGKGFSTKK